MAYTEYTGTVIPNTKDTTFEKDSKGFKLSTQEEIKDKVGNDWWHGPASLITAGVVGYGTKAAYDWLKSKDTPTPPRIDPTFGGGPPDDTLFGSPTSKTVENKAPKGWEQILARSEANAAAKAAEAAAKANALPAGYAQGVPSANPMDQLTAQPAAYPLIKPEPPAGTAPAPMQAAQPPAAPAAPPQAPQAAPVAPQAAPIAPSQPQTLMTGTGREVIAGQGPVPKRFPKEFASPLDVPKGYVFVPGAQYIDTLRNDLGQGTYTEQYKGREFPATYEQAVEEGKGINRSLNRPTREERKTQGIPPPETTKGITRQVGQGKLVKVAGVAGSLVAIADIAKAAEQGKYGQAAAQGLDVATDYIPVVSQLKQGMSPTSAGAPVVPPQQVANAALLGSPYAQTDWAKTQRLREKAGAGRGTLPASAYR
jgi:hypothetical protein